MNGLFKKGFPPKPYRIHPNDASTHPEPREPASTSRIVAQLQIAFQTDLLPVNSLAPASPLSVRASDKRLPSIPSYVKTPGRNQRRQCWSLCPQQQMKLSFIIYPARGRGRQKRLSSNKIEWGEPSLKMSPCHFSVVWREAPRGW